MMDYKKAYYSLIERLKEAKEDDALCNERYCCVIDGLIQEQEESERIRKAISQCVEDMRGQFEKLYSVHHKDAIDWLEKQGEKNTAKPKFYEGDWIAHNVANFVFQIVGVGTYGYNVVNREGYAKTISLSNEENYHLWTIKDAKGGDVVVDKSDGAIGIFQSIGHHPDGGSYNDPSYCFLHCHYEEGFFFEHGCTIDSDDLIPATKEQRDTLMKAMVDAGYEWDEEKKELRKIKQKSAWSEEDDVKLNDTINLIEQSGNVRNIREHYISWLQSIKQRATWKPSNEQIEALKEAVDAYIVEVEDNNCSMYAYTHLEICTDEDLSKICKAGDKAKVIIIKQK